MKAAEFQANVIDRLGRIEENQTTFFRSISEVRDHLALQNGRLRKLEAGAACLAGSDEGGAAIIKSHEKRIQQLGKHFTTLLIAVITGSAGVIAAVIAAAFLMR